MSEPSETPTDSAATAGDEAVLEPAADIESGECSGDTESSGLEVQLAEARDRALRSQAELDNYRKRSQRELQDTHRYANIELMRALLPVMDNVQRAVEATDTDETEGLLDGVKLMGQQLSTVLEQYHCQPIESLGQPFDPNLHEAILQQPSEEYASGVVMQVTQVGYQLHDRVIRPAQVIVSSGAAQTG